MTHEEVARIAHENRLLYRVKRDIMAIASMYPSAFNLYDEPLDRLARRVIATVRRMDK